MPKLGLFEKIEKDFGSFANFREKFTEAAITLFGSGWVWLVCKFFLECIILRFKDPPAPMIDLLCIHICQFPCFIV